MHVVVIENQKEWQIKIRNWIINNWMQRGIEGVELDTYSSGKEALLSYKKAELLILEPLLPEEDGFKVAEELHKRDKEVKIIFLTMQVEYARKGYLYHAYRFIDKRYMEELGEAFDSYCKENCRQRIICHSSVLGKIEMDPLEVLYIETFSRKLKYHMRDTGEYICKGSILEEARKLEQFGFYLIHRSYIVNMAYIQSYKRNSVRLYTGEEVDMSVRRAKTFKEAFLNWCLKENK